MWESEGSPVRVQKDLLGLNVKQVGNYDLLLGHQKIDVLNEANLICSC